MGLENELDRKYGKIALRLFLLVLLPFMLGAVVMPHTHDIQGVSLNAPSDSMNGQGNVSYAFNQSQEMAQATASLSAIFPLANYLDSPPLISHGNLRACFEDTGSVLTLSNGTQLSPNFEWAIHLSDGRVVMLRANSSKCISIAQGNGETYAWTATVPTGLDSVDKNSTLTFMPQTNSYQLETMDYGLLQGLALIPVFYLFIWYPLAGIWRKLMHGMLEQ